MSARFLLLIVLSCLVTSAFAADVPPPKPVQAVDAPPVPVAFPLSETSDVEEFDTGECPPMPIRMLESGQERYHDGPVDLVSYDLRTGERTRAPASRGSSAPWGRTPAGIGAVGASQEPVDKDFSGLMQVLDPSLGIYPQHVKIKMKFLNAIGEEHWYTCSGTMVDPMHVLTAGHCVYVDADSAGIAIDDFAVYVEVMPGYEAGEGPVGKAVGVQIHSWSGWTDSWDYDWDLALIDLERPVGAITGWRTLGYSNAWSWFEGGSWARYSYPGKDHYGNAVYDGEYMYQHWGTFDFDEDLQIGYDRDMYKGTSGSGAIREGGVYAVVSHGQLGDYYQYSWDTRVSTGTHADMAADMDEDRPSTPDLHALDVQTEWDGAGIGQQITGMTFLAHNYSTATFSGTMSYSVWLSTNDQITDMDTFVTSGSANLTLGALESAVVNVPEATCYVPAGLSEGDYYLGVIITNVDADTNNNASSGDDAHLFGVLCTPGPSPVLAFPEDGHPCVPTDLTLNWGSVPGTGVMYDLQVAESLYGYEDFVTTTSTQHLVTGLDEGTLYWWRVRARKTCGATSNWTLPRHFYTEGQLNELSKLEPAPDRACLDTTVEFSWDEIPNADFYRIWIQNDDGSTWGYVSSATSPVSATGLTPGAEYRWSIRPRDACGQWGTYGQRSSFFVRHDAAPAPVPVQPLAGAALSDTVVCEVAFDHQAGMREIFVETAAGDPYYGQPVNGEKLTLLTMPEGDYRWHARAESCTGSGDAWGPWTDWIPFTIDLTPPSFASAPWSPSHTPGVWSSQALVNVNWDHATDNDGVAWYRWSWSDQPDSTPSGDQYAYTTGIEQELGDGTWWFHLAAEDSAGNVSDPVHLGPIMIDLAPPTPPVLTGTVPDGGYFGGVGLDVEWTPSTDAGSGVAGYSIHWSTSSALTIDDTVDTTELSSGLATPGEGPWYFYIRPVDVFGNAGPQQRYVMYVDWTPPTMNMIEPYAGSMFFTGQVTLIDFNASDVVHWEDLLYEHAYSTDGGATWLSAELCENGSGGTTGCHQGGTNPFPVGSPQNSYWLVPWTPQGSQVLYRVRATDPAGNIGEALCEGPFMIFTSTDVGDGPSRAPALVGARPNPFNPQTTISFDVPRPMEVSLEVYALDGRVVRTLIADGSVDPGRNEIQWDGTDDGGQTVASGIYLCRLTASGFTQSMRVTLVK